MNVVGPRPSRWIGRLLLVLCALGALAGLGPSASAAPVTPHRAGGRLAQLASPSDGRQAPALGRRNSRSSAERTPFELRVAVTGSSTTVRARRFAQDVDVAAAAPPLTLVAGATSARGPPSSR